MSGCSGNCSSCGESCSDRKPESLLAEPNQKSNVKKVIAVVSGKGGVGKSTVTSMLAVAMRKLGYKTAILDADVTGPSIPRAFGLHEQIMGSDDGMIPAETPEGGYDFTPFFDDIRPIVQQYDLACINQETILVQDRSLIASYPIFGSPIEVADALADAGFNVVTFAGNHCFDKKETGVTDTLRYFHETYPDITTLGIHDSEADAAVIPIVEKNGIRIAMLNFTYGLNNSMPEKRWMVDMLSSTDTVCGRIAQAKQEADFVIVFPHWGTEDELSPDESQLRWAQEMADAGADLIIGAHPHTLQPTGLLTAADGRDVPVYYSLGNFLSHQKEMINLLGGMASVTIVKDKDGTRVEEYELKPTINVILRDPASGWYDYRPMLLEDYTPELAAQNRFTDCTVEAMQTLYEDIVG